MMLWTWVYKYLFECLLSVILDIYPEMELLDDMVILCLIFLKNLHTLFHRNCTILHSHQQYTRVSFSQHPCQHLLSFVFLIIGVLTGVRWYLTVVLIFISLIISDIEHYFIYLSVRISVTSLLLSFLFVVLFLSFLLDFSCLNAIVLQGSFPGPLLQQLPQILVDLPNLSWVLGPYV